MQRVTFKGDTEAAARELATAWIDAQGDHLDSTVIDVVKKEDPERYLVSVEYERR